MVSLTLVCTGVCLFFEIVHKCWFDLCNWTKTYNMAPILTCLEPGSFISKSCSRFELPKPMHTFTNFSQWNCIVHTLSTRHLCGDTIPCRHKLMKTIDWCAKIEKIIFILKDDNKCARVRACAFVCVRAVSVCTGTELVHRSPGGKRIACLPPQEQVRLRQQRAGGRADTHSGPVPRRATHDV